MYTLSFMPDIRFRETKIFQKNGFNKNNYLGHAEYFLHFVWKESIFLTVGGRPPPLLGDMSPKKSSFFYTLPN